MDKLKIFEVGNIIHGFVVEVLKSDKNKDIKLLECELPFKINIDDFVISGRVDDLLLLKSDDKKIIVEVKSTKNVSKVKQPELHHAMQLQFYM